LRESFLAFIGVKCRAISTSKGSFTVSTDGGDGLRSFALALAGRLGWAFF